MERRPDTARAFRTDKPVVVVVVVVEFDGFPRGETGGCDVIGFISGVGGGFEATIIGSCRTWGR